MSDLIDEFFNIVEPYCDAPESYIKAGAYFLVSDLLGRFFICREMPLGGRPNLWFIMSSIPGRMRRSSVISYTAFVLKRVLKRFYEKTGHKPTILKEEDFSDDEKEELTRQFYKDLIDDNTLEEGTPEGIADAIEEAHNKHGETVFRIISTEMGGVFKGMSKDYNVGVSTLLSKLYYGEGGKVSLSRRSGKGKGRSVPEGIYVSMFSGMQEPRHYITKDMIRQGLLRRIMIIFIPKAYRWLEPINPDRYKVYNELKSYAEKLCDLMIEYHKEASNTYPVMGYASFIWVKFGPGVTKEINKYSKELDSALDENPNDLNIFRQSLWEHLAKLAMVKRIGKGKLQQMRGLDVSIITVSQDDMKEAREFLDTIAERTENVVDEIGEVDVPIKSHETALDRVYRKILNKGSKGISRTPLYRSLKGMTAKDLNQLIETLRRQGRVIKKPTVNRRNQEVIMYYATEAIDST